jgi:hypothetical protein
MVLLCLLLAQVPSSPPLSTSVKWTQKKADAEFAKHGWEHDYVLSLPDRIFVVSVGRDNGKPKVVLNATNIKRQVRLYVRVDSKEVVKTLSPLNPRRPLGFTSVDPPTPPYILGMLDELLDKYSAGLPPEVIQRLREAYTSAPGQANDWSPGRAANPLLGSRLLFYK